MSDAKAAFLNLGRSGQLPDATARVYAALLDFVASRVDPDFSWSRPSAQPGATAFNRALLAPAWEELSKRESVNLSLGGKPCDLTPLGYLPAVRRLSVRDCRIQSLRPLRSLSHLVSLDLVSSGLTSPEGLDECQSLEELTLSGETLRSLAPLALLPRLRQLEIHNAPAPLWQTVSSLPALVWLRADGKVKSFAEFPQMPKLEVLWGASTRSLAGVERLPKLRALVNFACADPSWEPLVRLPELSHLHSNRCAATALQPLARIATLREIDLTGTRRFTDLEALRGLPGLRKVDLQGPHDKALLKSIRGSLQSWDVEFLTAPRATPALRVVEVSEAEFRHYDDHPYGLRPGEYRHERTLSSELDWLDQRLEKALAGLTADDDFALPSRWPGARSRTVVLLTEEAVVGLPQRLLALQHVLATCRHDWILYFQLENEPGLEAIWVYPDRLVVAPGEGDRVRSLLK